jgi:hypothetical protein
VDRGRLDFHSGRAGSAAMMQSSREYRVFITKLALTSAEAARDAMRTIFIINISNEVSPGQFNPFRVE